ncbi:hypothetical protein [Holdemania sp. Marseille-P2844]|uniref:hypothetical protein n=1 Tax=Holdemania sp. Marseille-P2844 TaxID=1852366 RepID=UPI0011149DF8|nr:hypothetical protein [Holdemania sp. Marseille-P2844]
MSDVHRKGHKERPDVSCLNQKWKKTDQSEGRQDLRQKHALKAGMIRRRHREHKTENKNRLSKIFQKVLRPGLDKMRQVSLSSWASLSPALVFWRGEDYNKINDSAYKKAD